jgi:hypothetical protein
MEAHEKPLQCPTAAAVFLLPKIYWKFASLGVFYFLHTSRGMELHLPVEYPQTGS